MSATHAETSGPGDISAGSAPEQRANAVTNQTAAAPDPYPVAWTRLPDLGAHNTGLASPTVEELGIAWIHDVCIRLWQYRSVDFEPNLNVPLKESQWRETCALAGSIAESLMLAAATYVDIAWHEEAMYRGVEHPRMAVAQRFLADALPETTTGVGHRLVNLVARVMRTDLDVRQRMDGDQELGQLGTCYRPFVTEKRDAWLSLNEGTVKRLRTVATAAAPVAIIDALDRLGSFERSPEWKAVSGHRAKNFHRWRREHEYVSGVDEGTGIAQDVVDRHGVVTGRRIGSYNLPYTAGAGLGAQTIAIARSGLEATAEAADDLLGHILAALPELAAGYTVLLKSSGGIRFDMPRHF